MLASPEEQALNADIKERRSQYIALRNKILKLKAQGQQDEAAQLTNGQAGADARRLRRQHPRHAERTRAARSTGRPPPSTQLYRAGRINLIVLAVLALALGAVLAWLLTRSITRPLNEAVRVAQTVAAGDLSSADRGAARRTKPAS